MLVSLQTADGSVWVFRYDEIEKFTGIDSSGSPATVFLNNGSKIVGRIVEEVVGRYVRIKTSDGSLWVFKYEEAEKALRTLGQSHRNKWLGESSNRPLRKL